MSFIPNPAVYEGQQAHALQAYQSALSSINQKRQGLLQQYGMTADAGKDGSYSNYRVDPNSRYGAIQMLKYNQANDLNSAWNAAAERHIGHTGLGAQGESDLRFRQGQQTLDLGRQFTSSIGDLAQQQSAALAGYNSAVDQSRLQAIQDAIAAQQFTPAYEDPYVAPSASPVSTTAPIRSSAARAILNNKKKAVKSIPITGEWRYR